MKKIWKLLSKDDKYLDAIQNLTLDEIDTMPESGDGKAVFLKPMNQKELEQYNFESDPKIKKLIEKLKIYG